MTILSCELNVLLQLDGLYSYYFYCFILSLCHKVTKESVNFVFLSSINMNEVEEINNFVRHCILRKEIHLLAFP